MTTLKDVVKIEFSKPYAGFVFDADDTKAVKNGAAVLQCVDDHTVSLACGMSTREAVDINIRLLALLCTVSGWQTGHQWIMGRFNEAAKTKEGGTYTITVGRMSYELLVNRVFNLATLTVHAHG